MKTTLSLYQVDAFTDTVFAGNPAAVCPLDRWLDDSLLQQIAAENNLSETAFIVSDQSAGSTTFDIRWFTPNKEVDLCGHATLATAHILYTELGCNTDRILFNSKSGPLYVSRKRDLYCLDFPTLTPVACDPPTPLLQAFTQTPRACLKQMDYILVFENAADVLDAAPDMQALKQLDLRGVCITAPSSEFDFISRFFAPNYGIGVDPVTGSTFNQLSPYWAEQLDKTYLKAKQVSPRGGQLECELKEDRVLIWGQAVTYLNGKISIDKVSD